MVTDRVTDLADVEAAIAGCNSVLRDVEARAQRLHRELGEGAVPEPVVRGELYRLAKAVRAGTAVMLERLDRGAWQPGQARPAVPETDTETNEKE